LIIFKNLKEGFHTLSRYMHVYSSLESSAMHSKEHSWNLWKGQSLV